MGWWQNLFTRELAIIKNDDGLTVAKRRVKLTEDKFEWDGRTYVMNRQYAHRDVVKGLIRHTHKYYYNINNPAPFAFNKHSKDFAPMVDPKTLNVIMEAEILKKLNTVPGGLFGNIKPMHIVMVVGAIAVLYYMYTQGYLGGVTP